MAQNIAISVATAYRYVHEAISVIAAYASDLHAILAQAHQQPTTRRYSDEEKAAAMRMVRKLRAEFAVTQGTVRRVATQLGYGVKPVRT